MKIMWFLGYIYECGVCEFLADLQTDKQKKLQYNKGLIAYTLYILKLVNLQYGHRMILKQKDQQYYVDTSRLVLIQIFSHVDQPETFDNFPVISSWVLSQKWYIMQIRAFLLYFLGYLCWLRTAIFWQFFI